MRGVQTVKNIDQLFVRACKVRGPEKRVRSVYRRFYPKHPSPDIHIIGILTELIDRYCPMKVTDIIHKLKPEEGWLYCEEEYDYNEACLNVLIGHLSVAPVSSFLGWRIPARFK